MKEAFDISRLLTRFFDQPSAFRTLQARTGTLIAGSIALQYFDRSYYPSSDLDLYVHPRHRREVGNWLLSAGYAFCPHRDHDSDFETVISRNPQSEDLHYGVPGVAEVITFRRAFGDKAETVQVVTPRRSPMEVILSSHSSKSDPTQYRCPLTHNTNSLRHECHQLRESLLSIPFGHSGGTRLSPEL